MTGAARFRSRALRRVTTRLLFTLALWSITSLALAAPELHGAVDGRMLLGITNRYGGSLGVDLWAGSGRLRLGGTIGVGAVSKDDATSSRVFSPLGLSAALMPREGASGPTLVLRGGVYAGAQKSGLILGPFMSCALGFRKDLGEGASVRVGVDFWGLFMNNGGGADEHKRGILIGPYVGLGF
jgi:hypothetical protein